MSGVLGAPSFEAMMDKARREYEERVSKPPTWREWALINVAGILGIFGFWSVAEDLLPVVKKMRWKLYDHATRFNERIAWMKLSLKEREEKLASMFSIWNAIIAVGSIGLLGSSLVGRHR